MKYFTFYRENNKFDDILNNMNVKPIIKTKITWFQHLMIGIEDKHEKNISVITLTFGDDMVSNLTKDFTPIPGVDYMPKKDKNKFTKKSQSK